MKRTLFGILLIGSLITSPAFAGDDAQEVVTALKTLNANDLQRVTVLLVDDATKASPTVLQTSKTAQGRLAIADAVSPLNGNFSTTLFSFARHLTDLRSAMDDLGNEFALKSLDIEIIFDGIVHGANPAACGAGCIPVAYPKYLIQIRIAEKKERTRYFETVSAQFGPNTAVESPDDTYSDFMSTVLPMIRSRFELIRNAQ